MEPRVVVIFFVTCLYIIGTTWIAWRVRKNASSSGSFTSGGRTFPAFMIAALMLSEFIGSSASIGTAQTAFEVGISATWNLVALGVGFLLLGVVLVHKYRATGLDTVSGILERCYGPRMRYAASLMTIVALSIVTVSVYAGGGAVLSQIAGISSTWACVLCGLVSVVYMAMGGMRSVVYTNLANCIVKYVGAVLALAFALSASGGIQHLQASLSADMFNWHAVGFGKIFAWFLGGVGSIFATQYVLQAIMIADNTKKARDATVMLFSMLIPFGIVVALIGTCAAFLYPHIHSIDAFPAVVAHMPAWAASLAVIGLAGSMLGGISANTIASATLVLRDFYDPYFNPEKDDRKSVFFLRAAIVVIGLLPLIPSLYATQILDLAFVGKALRASLAVFILLAFYAPGFGTPAGAFCGVVSSIVMTVGWYLAHEPFGINSTYFALFCPIATMAISHVYANKRSRPATLVELQGPQPAGESSR